jgi:hypothetical protein
MAGPVNSSIVLPSDSGNAGKKVRTQTRVVGADTVHEHFFIEARKAQIVGIHRLASGVNSVQAAAQNGTTTAFAWLHVPTAVTGKAARIRQIKTEFNFSGSTAMPTNPRIGLARLTFTGTASGATLAGAKVDPDGAAPVLDIRTANTGLTVTLNTDPGSLLSTVFAPTSHTVGTAASFTVSPTTDQWLLSSALEEDEWPIIKPGQGLVIYQPDAATATDLRRFTFNVLWDEVDIA